MQLGKEENSRLGALDPSEENYLKLKKKFAHKYYKLLKIRLISEKEFLEKMKRLKELEEFF